MMLGGAARDMAAGSHDAEPHHDQSGATARTDQTELLLGTCSLGNVLFGQ